MGTGSDIRVDITAKPLDTAATVKVSSDSTATAANGWTVNLLLPGDIPKCVPVEVTTQAGAKSTYVLMFNGTSSDASLEGLSLSSGVLSPAFNPEVTQYTAEVDYIVKDIELTATTNDNYARLIVNGRFYYTSSSSKIPLGVGANRLEVTVIAPDGSARTYTVTVIRTTTLPPFRSAAGPG